MEDKKKKKQEEKKKKESAQKKVSLWQALLFVTDIQPPSPSKDKKCYPTQSILPLPFSQTKPRCQCCNTISTILILIGAQPNAAFKYAQVFLLQLHHKDHMHIEHMHFVMCVSPEAFPRDFM